MTSLRTRPLVLLLALTVLSTPVLSAEDLPRAQPEAVGLSGPRLERLTEAMQAYVDDGRLSGAVVLVARRGRVAYLQSFGQRDIESRSPMADDAIFRIASQTKAIVSTGVMLLQEEGKLLISDPVGRYLPEFARTQVAVAKDGGGYDVVDARGRVTIRQLLTHTSGVSYGSGPASDRWESAGIQGWYFADREEPVGDTIARLAALPFDAHPGEQWIYGYNTDILGALIESVSGQPLDEFIQTRILDPLGMEDTHFYLPLDKRDRLATVYSATNDGLDRAPNPGHMVGQGAYVDGPRASFSGGAGLLSTATDYARFLQMTLNGGELEGTRLLGRKTVELMTTNHLTDQPFRAGQGFGLGFSIVEDVGARGLPGSKGEYGWGGAYHSTYWVDPAEELVVVYLTQLIPAGGLDDQGKIRALIYQAIED
ncbi:MAG: serine hydrolase domain-containing protein [Vicinamibacterales bacterium]|nr:serine hydrolase domain-containing protein [Vicinamibacterales bacterium]